MPKTALLACLLGLLFLGCGSTNRPPTAQEADDHLLFQVGEIYRAYQTSKQRPPQKLADLRSMSAAWGNAYDAIRRGDIILRFGATMTETQEEPGPPTSDEVLAYPKEVPEKGGRVLMLDRNVKALTADAFKSAKLAGSGSAGK